MGMNAGGIWKFGAATTSWPLQSAHKQLNHQQNQRNSQVSLLKKSSTPLPLDERLREIKKEVDAWIDSVAEAEYRRSEGNVPLPVIKNILMNRSACLCHGYEKLREVQDRDSEIEGRKSE
jgi:hypothetical protein